MRSSRKPLMIIGLIVTGVGIVDALVSNQWDLMVIFIFSLLVQLVMWASYRAGRTEVTLRPDLARWIKRHSLRTGEPFDDVLDRAIAGYHHSVFLDKQPES